MNEFEYREMDETYTPENEDAYARTSIPLEINFPNYIPFEMCAFESTLEVPTSSVDFTNSLGTKMKNVIYCEY